MIWVPLLLVACVAAAVSCARLCRAAVVEAALPDTVADGRRELTLPEAAYLSGGPLRVTDLTLVLMHRHRRLLLAHTGWATVVDPDGRDELERSVIGAIGPGGQSPTAAIRPVIAAADAVRALADRLVAAGLAVPEAGRRSVCGGVRSVRLALALTVALGAGAAALVPGHERMPVYAWFALPLVLTAGCLVIARAEVHPYNRWASPTGLALLAALAPDGPLAPDDPLTALATRGPATLDPQLRAALRGH
ncbi:MULTISPECIES: TIGR04222 domain-containing membrane protein [unclassified Streptomyces]|uniref:TIGR04222 domain-containing membrane protein n=1 Tax=unclassified Streptomyces TaxID=2593676 RepID=UPI0033BC02BE